MDIKNKISKKDMILLGCVVIAIIALIVYFVAFRGNDSSSNNEANNEETPNGEVNGSGIPTENTNEGVIGDKELDGLKFTNSSLVSTDSYATLTTMVENTTDSDIEVRIFDIIVKDADGNVIVTLQGYVGDVIPANQSREITSNVDMDLSYAADVEYVLVK